MINIEKLLNSTEKINKIRIDVLSGFNKALDVVDPYKSVLNFLKVEGNLLFVKNKSIDLRGIKNIRFIAFGKASIRMAEAVLSLLKVKEGIVVGVEDNFTSIDNIKYIKGGHPIPNENSILGGKSILEIAKSTEENDLTLVLISGGGSALVELPLIPLERLQLLTKELLKRGANINELNAVRKHLSMIKGGRLLKQFKGKVISLIISDVVGDPLDVIASGPTYFDSSTFSDALIVLKKYNLENEFEDVVSIFEKGISGEIEETLKENEKINADFENYLTATNFLATSTLKKHFEDLGYSVLFLGSEIEGIASEVAKVLSSVGKAIARNELDLKKPVAVVFGGETTVIVKGNGIGGRNSELTLYVAKFLDGYNFVFSSIGTDGIDGVSPASGAIADSFTLKRARDLGLNIDSYLKENDSFTFFSKLNDAIITGATGTNVADIGVLVIF